MSSQRLGSEETAPSRVQHLHCCLLDGLQKWRTVGLDPARCSRNLYLPLWAQRSSHRQHEELQLVPAGIVGLWYLPCTYRSFTKQVWGQHNGNYSSWTIWFSTPRENPISAEDSSMVPYIRFDRPFTVPGLEDIVIPGLLVAYPHKFDVQAHLSRIYFVTSTAAYSCDLLASFVVSALTQRDQPALFYLVLFVLTACLAVAFLCQELRAFWTGSDFTKQPSLSSLRNQYQLPWCPKRTRSTNVTERSGRTYNQSYTK